MIEVIKKEKIPDELEELAEKIRADEIENVKVTTFCSDGGKGTNIRLGIEYTIPDSDIDRIGEKMVRNLRQSTPEN